MKIYILILSLCLAYNIDVNAQQELEPTRFSSFALQFASPDINADPYSMMPSVAKAYGFGSYVDNPAAMAMIENSEFMFSFYRQDNSSSNFYLDTTEKSDELNHKLGSIGIAYSIPSIRGSLVIGAGYNRMTSNTDRFRISGRNNTSTITDSFLDTESKFFDLAFDTYATDWGDVEQTYLESIFRIGFEPGNFPGINQEVEVLSETYAGEYTAFLATEFRKDLFMGISASYFYGESRYRENFLESDTPNNYDGDFIEGSDIADILVNDTFDTEIRGYNFRAGLVYKIGHGLSAGVSYQLPAVFRMSERNNYSIQTSLDDNSLPFFSKIESDGAFRYRIKRPGILKAGLAYDNSRFSFSISTEYADYQNLSYDLLTDREARTTNRDIWQEKEMVINNSLKDNYNAVIDILVGAEAYVTEKITLKAGYAFMPERYKLQPRTVNQLSAGFSYKILDYLRLDVNGQYQQSEKQTILYEYVDFDNEAQSSVFDSEVQRIRVIVALKLLF